MVSEEYKRVVIIGAGPAGLTAAYKLAENNLPPVVLEQRDKVGGLARTETYKGNYFDMGGHRFYTKSRAVSKFWQEILTDDFLLRPRLSRIYYRNKFFNYPLKYTNALAGLGVWQAILIVLSYLKWQLFPYNREDSFEQWVTNRFGRRLYEIFFKTYTEKIWGIPCTELKAEWAAQRIKDLTLRTALTNMFIKPDDPIKTLIEEFNYPRLGPGMLWERVSNEIEKRDGIISLNSPVTKIHCNGNRIESVAISRNGREETIYGTDFISSMPLVELIQKLDSVPENVLQAANKLNYRDFITVCLIANKPHLFPDNWIYIHSPGVKVGRIQNFKNWSLDMVSDPSKTSLGLEYFCTEGDELWVTPDDQLIELGKKELEQIGLAKYTDFEDGCVFRVQKAYPVYDSDYHDYLSTIINFINGLENFQTIGRNGLHRYNNQDHSMITGMLAVRNLVFMEKNDLWNVNVEQEYQEEIGEEELLNPDVNEQVTGMLVRVFTRIDPIAFGLALVIVLGVLLFMLTIFLVMKGGDIVGPNLQLLSQFFPGYQVNLPGSIIGFFYVFVIGFIIGSGSAYLRNLVVYLTAVIIHKDIEIHVLENFLDYL